MNGGAVSARKDSRSLIRKPFHADGKLEKQGKTLLKLRLCRNRRLVKRKTIGKK
jgi:hypothetical protein